jgi:hypothetical protein
MNYRGSYRRLLGNSKSAILGAIELYNKPSFEYRDEVVVILLLNGWELLLKAIVSKSGSSIYRKKEPGRPYQTISLMEAFQSAVKTNLWPSSIENNGIGKNLDLLRKYRNSAIHFYNADGFTTIVYQLAQTAITSYHDLLRGAFGQDFSERMNWQLLPIGMRVPVDPIEYLRGSRSPTDRRSVAVTEFLMSIREAFLDLEQRGIDTSRLLTVFDVSLNSVKRIANADIVVGVVDNGGSNPFMVTKKLDPNYTHPFRMTEVLAKLGNSGKVLSRYDFQALVYKYNLRDEQRYCWTEKTSNITKWSHDVVMVVLAYTEYEIQLAHREYSRVLKQRRSKKVT